MHFRKLFSAGMRDPVRTFHGILPHPDLYPFWSHRHNLVGQLLAEPKRDARQSGLGRHHRAHHDHPHVVHQRRATQDFLCQVHRCLPGNMFRYGLRIIVR